MRPGKHKPFTGFEKESRASQSNQLWGCSPCKAACRHWFPATALASQGLGKVQGDSTASNHSSTKAHLLLPAVANAWGSAGQACTRNTPIAQQSVGQITLNSCPRGFSLCKLQIFHLNYRKGCLDFRGLLCPG